MPKEHNEKPNDFNLQKHREDIKTLHALFIRKSRVKSHQCAPIAREMQS
jgi:hypothetical protein